MCIRRTTLAINKATISESSMQFSSQNDCLNLFFDCNRNIVTFAIWRSLQCSPRWPRFVMEICECKFYSCWHFIQGEKPECKFIEGLPVIKGLSPQLSLPCDLNVCLLAATCEKKCSLQLSDVGSKLVSQLVKSAVCQKGLTLCPAKNTLRLECLVTGVSRR